LESDDHIWKQLGHAHHLRSSEDQVLWNIFGIFWASNTILLAGLFSSELDAFRVMAVSVIPAVGFFMSFIWLYIQVRSLGHIERFEKLTETLERELIRRGNLDATIAASGKINDKDYEDCLRYTPYKIRHLMLTSSYVSCIAWFAGIVYFRLSY
jgi:hypothetical protein